MLREEKPPQKHSVPLPITSTTPCFPPPPLISSYRRTKTLLKSHLKAHSCFVAFPASNYHFPLEATSSPCKHIGLKKKKCCNIY